MERRDGKDPFDAATYTSPATIKSMVELRAFCAAFFEQHIRDHTLTVDQKLLEKFYHLIFHSTLLFARARAVIPELQLQNPSSELTQGNPNVQRVLQMTEELRRSPDSNRDHLIEESAWSRLAKDGQEHFKKKSGRLANDSKENRARDSRSPLRSLPATPALTAPTGILGQKEQAAGPISPLRLSISMSTEQMEGKSAADSGTASEATVNLDDSSRHNLPVSGADQNMTTIRLGNIPTFIPGAEMGNAHDLVWSPTSGTRQRKPEEKIESQKRDPAVPTKFGQEISGNTPRFVKSDPTLSSLEDNTQEKSHGRGLSTSVTVKDEPYHSPNLPLAPAGSPSARLRSNNLSSHRARNGLDVTSFLDSRPDSVGPPSNMVRQLHQEGLVDGNTNPSFDPNLSNLQHLIDRTPGVIDPGPFSAPHRMLGFDDTHENDQGMYGGPRNMSYEPQAHHGRYGAVGSPPFQAQPGRVQEYYSKPKRRNQFRLKGQYPSAYPQQQQFDVDQSVWNPQQMQQPLYGAPANESLIVPPPGSMHPVDYWNMLYQRGIDIHTRLASAGIPMTDIQRDYVARLGEARVAAVASRMPLRGPMSPIEWLDVLAKELEELQLPGAMPLTEVVVDRKKDYERAVRREIELAEIELGIV